MFIDGLGLSGYRSFSGSLQEIGPFAKINLLIGQNNSGKSNTGRVVEKVDKVKIAHEVVKSAADLDVLDLRKMVSQLIRFIRSANDFADS